MCAYEETPSSAEQGWSNLYTVSACAQVGDNSSTVSDDDRAGPMADQQVTYDLQQAVIYQVLLEHKVKIGPWVGGSTWWLKRTLLRCLW